MYACEGFRATLAVYFHISTDGLCRVLCHIEHLGAVLQRAIVIVGSHATVIQVGETLAAVVHHVHGLGEACLRLVFRVIDDRHHLQAVVRRFLQPHHVDSSVGAIVTHQLGIHLGVAVILTTFHVHDIRRGTLIRFPFGIDTLLPSLGCGDYHTVVGDNGFLSLVESAGKGDITH